MAHTYLITNVETGKQYVGFTKGSVWTRLSQHMQEAKSGRTTSVLHAAIRKYGPHSFSIQVLAKGNIADMLDLERTKIAELGTLAPAGYNLTEGGEYAEYSVASRIKMSDSAKTRAALEDRSEQLAEAGRTRWAMPGARRRAAAIRRAYRKPGVAERNAAIRIRYAQGGISQKALGAEFGLSQAAISLIVRRKL